MKVIILADGGCEALHKRLQDLNENSEKRDRIIETKKYGNTILSASRTVLPCGVIFHFEAVEDICTLRYELLTSLSMRLTHILTEAANGIYYSEPLVREWCKDPSLYHPSSWDFREIFVFQKGNLIAEERITPDTGVEDYRKKYPDADEFLEVWCLEWEYYDKYVLNYWFEWRGPCLWGGNRKADEKFGYAINIDSLPLSPQTKERVKEMIRWHDTALDWDNPGGDSPWTDEENERFEKAETELYEDLKKELGDEFEIRRS